MDIADNMVSSPNQEKKKRSRVGSPSHSRGTTDRTIPIATALATAATTAATSAADDGYFTWITTHSVRFRARAYKRQRLNFVMGDTYGDAEFK